MSNLLSVTIMDRKYTVEQNENGDIYALRYDEYWRDCCGDGLILGLAQEIEYLRSKLEEVTAENYELEQSINSAKAEGVKEFYRSFHPKCTYEGYEVRTMAMNYVTTRGGDSSDMTNGYQG